MQILFIYAVEIFTFMIIIKLFFITNNILYT